MLVDADLFAEIAQLALGISVIRRKVGQYVDGYLQVYKRTGYILYPFEKKALFKMISSEILMFWVLLG